MPFWDTFGRYSDTSFSLYEQATLYVPEGCKSKYEKVEGWNRFKKIVEFNVNSVHNLPADVMLNARSLSPLFDLQGRRIQGEPRKGMYVKDGKKYVRP